MQASFALTALLPAVFVLILLGLGMSLKAEDFRRAVTNPKPVLVALLCQVALLPFICFWLVLASDLPPSIAVGMMLLAASPGGTSSIIYSHLAGGNAALNVTVMLVNSAVALFTLPITVNVASLYFFGEGTTLPLQFDRILQIVGLVVIPTMLGVLFRSHFPRRAATLSRPVNQLAMAFLAAIIIYSIVTQWSVLATWGPIVGVTALAFNLISMFVGYVLPRIFGLARPEAIAITFEIGIHNAAFVITLALSEVLLNDAEMAIPPAIYALIAYLTAAIFALFLRRTAPAT